MVKKANLCFEFGVLIIRTCLEFRISNLDIILLNRSLKLKMLKVIGVDL